MTNSKIAGSFGGFSIGSGLGMLLCEILTVVISPGCSPPVVTTADPSLVGGNRGSAGAGGGSGGSTKTKDTGSIIHSMDAATPVIAGAKDCGNGELGGVEQCDDGNINDGDGCNRLCQMEANWTCPEPGQKCVYIAVCGNEIVTSDEMCDDGNTQSGDGCSSDCKTIEPGWQCRVPGKPCTPKCGDATISGYEKCDDGNLDDGDGCSSLCQVEQGWGCSGTPSKCSKTACGNKVIEGGEGCDDGNTLPFDGCSQECQIEPDCKGDSCISKCGDGIVFANEECDDGNAADGDGCSHDCKKEPGWTCTRAEIGQTMAVPIVYRDFRYHKPSDFQADVKDSHAASKGIAKDTLDEKGKPVYTGLQGDAVKIESQSTFAAWFTDTPGTNHTTAGHLTLWDNGQGAFVNRYGPNGEQWLATVQAYYCGNKGEEILLGADAGPGSSSDSDGGVGADAAPGVPIPCTSRFAGGTDDCSKYEAQGLERVKCYLDGNTYKALYLKGKVDGNPLWFPVDGDTTITPKSEFEAAQVPPMYETLDMTNKTGTWPFDLDDKGNKILHNFSFTSEVRYWFKYESGKSYKLEFVGDDDVWVFVHKKLAVDIGGIHTPVQDSVDLTAKASTLGLKPGNVYEVAVFQAERQTTSSTYKLTLSGFNAAPTTCVPTCGDGVRVADEECDLGDQNKDDEYGGCSTACRWGTFCGDGVVNGKEECDEGKNNGAAYGDSNGCSVSCTKTRFCGDGKVDTDRGEFCDMGDLNGKRVDENGQPSDGPDSQVICNEMCQIVISIQ